MLQLSNGFKEYYYLLENGDIYNNVSGKIIKPDKRHLFYLKTNEGNYKKIALKTIYKKLYNKVFCIDKIQNMQNQHWKEINGTDGLNYISDKGRVKSYKGYTAVLLKPYTNQNGYYRVDINIDGYRQTKLVHKLVAQAFLPFPKKLDMQLHHKDNNKNNNQSNNLQWLTASEHAKKHYKGNSK